MHVCNSVEACALATTLRLRGSMAFGLTGVYIFSFHTIPQYSRLSPMLRATIVLYYLKVGLEISGDKSERFPQDGRPGPAWIPSEMAFHGSLPASYALKQKVPKQDSISQGPEAASMVRNVARL